MAKGALLRGVLGDEGLVGENLGKEKNARRFFFGEVDSSS